MVKSQGSRTVVVEAVADLVDDAKGVVVPLSKRAARELRQLDKRLAALRLTETKRVRQLATARQSKGRKQVVKRSKQVADVASEVAGLAMRIASLASLAAAAAVDDLREVVKDVGSAAAQAAGAVSPVKSAPANSSAGTPGAAIATAKPKPRTAATETPKPKTTQRSVKPTSSEPGDVPA